jgi:hypothetical protein
MNVPAKRFYALLKDMKSLVRQREGEFYSNLCQVALVPHLRRDGQENVLHTFYEMTVPPEDVRKDKTLDLSKDQDILGPSLKAMFSAKARYH